MKFAMITFAASVGSSAAGWTPALGYCSNAEESRLGGGVIDNLGTKESCARKCSSLDNCVEGYFCGETNCGGTGIGNRCFLFGEGLSRGGVGCGTIMPYPKQYPFTNDNFAPPAPVVPAPVTESPTDSPTASPTDALTASPTCVHEDCQEWDCDTWCECFDETKASVYTANNCDEDEDPCDCPGWSPAPTCANVELVGQGECGVGHGSQTCGTATAPSAWCNNPSYPLRLGVPWCTETFCNQCGDMFGIVYVGCTNGVQAVANSCQACGHNSRGPCRSGAKCLGRTSLRSDYGCSANLCKTCGVVGTKPCNNGDGQQICDAGLAPRRYGNPSENNCEVEQSTCGAPWTGACSTLPNVGGTFYNVIPGTKAPDMNNEFVHGGTFIL